MSGSSPASNVPRHNTAILPVRTTLPHDLLTVGQAAALIQMSESTIRTYIREGRLKAQRVAGMRVLRIARVEVLGLLEGIAPSSA